MQPNNSAPYHQYLLLIIGPILLYWKATQFGYVSYDDPLYISANEHVKHGISSANVTWAFKSTLMQLWHPVTWISFQLESSLFGADNVSARHMVNIGLHVLNGMMVFLVCRKLFAANAGQPSNWALWVALLFLVHPLHVQNVAWLSSRKELLCALFSLMAFYNHIKAVTEHRSKRLTVSLVLLVCAMLSKPTAAPLPALMISWHLLFYPEKFKLIKMPKLVVFHLLGCLVSLGVCAATISIQAKVYTDNLADSWHGLELFSNWLGLVLLSLAHYLNFTLMPINLALFIEADLPIDWHALTQPILICVFFASLVWLFRNSKLCRFGTIWFLLYWLPVSGMVPIGPNYVADRYAYQLSIGLLIFLVFALNEAVRIIVANNNAIQSSNPLTGLFRGINRISRLIGSKYLLSQLIQSIFLAFLVYLCIQQINVWSSDQQLFEHEIQVNPKQAYGPVYLGLAYSDKGENELALEQLNKSVELKPNGFYPYYFRAVLFEKLEQPQLAMEDYLSASRFPNIKTKHYAKIALQRGSWLLTENKRYVEALSLLQIGLKNYPEDEYLLALQKYFEQYLNHIN